MSLTKMVDALFLGNLNIPEKEQIASGLQAITFRDSPGLGGKMKSRSWRLNLALQNRRPQRRALNGKSTALKSPHRLMSALILHASPCTLPSSSTEDVQILVRSLSKLGDKHNPDLWADPKSRSTLGFHNLHHRSIGVQNRGFYLLDPPGAWEGGPPGPLAGEKFLMARCWPVMLLLILSWLPPGQSTPRGSSTQYLRSLDPRTIL